MYLLNFNFNLFKIKLILFISIFNFNFFNILFFNFFCRLLIIGFKKTNIILIILLGCLELSFYINLICKNKIFDIYYLLGLVFKNKTYHFDLLSYNILFYISLISLKFNLFIINNLIFFYNRTNFLHKFFLLNNFNLKLIFKYIFNLLFYKILKRFI